MEESIVKADGEVMNNIPVAERDSLVSRHSDYQSQFDAYDTPYLFEKHMQREKIAFETLALV